MVSIKVKGKSLRVKVLLLGCLCFCLLALASAERVAAQSFSFSDLFGQGDKLLKNMVTQIAALNAFETSVRQGYQSLKSGLTDIGNWKNGEFGAHQTYYSSLSQVNPSVKVFADDGSIAAQQQSIVSQFAAVRNLVGLTAAEQSYVREVEQMVLSDCARALNDLQSVSEAGFWAMTDDERIRRIAAVADEVKNLYEFTCRFVVRVRLLAAQRRSENDEYLNLKGWYGND